MGSCDTFVVLGSITKSGFPLFGKNSDREPNESQEMVFFERKKHDRSKLRCTYIDVDQVDETYAVLLSKPTWMWGAEMGMNEFGVVIGNEAVFLNGELPMKPALLGMDLLRLALERSKTAEQAAECICALLKKYGQGGNCAVDESLYYHNAFLVVDQKGAYVVETEFSESHVSKLPDNGDGMYTISNCKASSWTGSMRLGERFLETYFGEGALRRKRTKQLLLEASASHKLDVFDAMRVLRNQREDPSVGIWGQDISMHYGGHPIRRSQTTNSMIVDLSIPDLAFVTGTSAPDLSIFKPILCGSPLALGPPCDEKRPSQYQRGRLWWKHEILHRNVLRDYVQRAGLFKKERDALESKFINLMLEARRSDREDLVTAAFQASDEKLSEWIEMVRKEPIKTGSWWFYDWSWDRMNRAAKIDHLLQPSSSWLLSWANQRKTFHIPSEDLSKINYSK